MLGFFICSGSIAWLYQHLPQEYAPREDRGAFFVLVNAPEGSSYAYTEAYMNEIELRLMPYVEKNEITRLLVRTPRGFGNLSAFDNGIVIAVLNDWSQRRPANEIMANIRRDLADLSGVRAFPVMRQGLGGGIQKPVQFVVGGSSYEQLAEWRDILVEKINANNIGLEGLDWDYKETQPQMRINIDYTRAADLGIRLDTIGNTLQTMLGSRRVTTYNDDGQEYDVVLEGERAQQRTPTNLSNIYVRSERTQQLIPLSNFASLEEMADANSLNRFNRVRAITFDANLADGVSLEQALTFLEDLVAEHLPEEAVIDYKGQSREFKNSGQSILFVFALGLLVVFLVLAAQFESYVHPLVIMLTVPLAIAGGLLGLWLTGQSLNIYSQIGLIMLVGLAAKNGILIVEFANQLRDGGARFHEAIVDAALTRLRPVLMTAITTAAGAVPLIMASGAGAETRYVIGVVVLSGVVIATFFTLFVVPIAYALIARGTGSPNRTVKRLGVEKRLTPL
jgi:multidrug efflux pump